MNIVFIGCVEFSYRALELLVSFKPRGVNVVGVITKSKSSFNADFFDLSEICTRNKIPIHFEGEGKRSSQNFAVACNPDVIYCFGWSYLLSEDMLSIPSKGVVGFHPAALPKNRGRHPIIWSLALGLKTTASSFFLMDKGADSGQILSQTEIDIEYEDTAKTLYQKIISVALAQIEKFTFDLKDNRAKLIAQDHSAATYWRKRSRLDGQIDWRMCAGDIYNLIRALTKPYPGAEFKYKEGFYIVWSAHVNKDVVSNNFEPGKVLQIDADKILVKCSGCSSIWLDSHTLIPLPIVGEYL